MNIVKELGKKFIGNNPFLYHIISRECGKGNYLKATALTLLMLPAKKLLNLGPLVRKFEFLSSREYYSELQELLHISKPEGFELVRVGKGHDGAYVMLDDFHAGNAAYSFGIGNNVLWDDDIASRGYDVFMYDHTIDGLPEENPRFHWSKLGIADGHTQDDRLKTLDELIKINHHENKRNMILKMDVEGAEWGFLEQVSSETLSQFGQMTFEFHNIINNENPERVLSAFRKINQTHQLIHIHACNNGGYISFGHKKFCALFECTYVLRSQYRFSENYDVNLPLSIDEVSFKLFPEIELGRWNEDAEIDGKATVLVKVL